MAHGVTSPFSDADSVHVAVLPDFSRFARELRAGVDAAMRDFTTRVEAALGGVERAVADAGASLGNDFQRGGEAAERAFHELDDTARRELDSVDRHVARSASEVRSRFSTAAALAGAAFLGAGVAIGAGLAAVTGFGLKAAAEMEQVHVAFNALLGSVELGEAVFADIQRFAAITPFEFADLTGSARRFFIFAQNTGLAKTQVTEFLAILGNVASVTGAGAAGMDRVSLAMGQIAAKGRVQQEELLQIAEAFVGFNANAAIAAALGISTAEAMKRVSAGEVSADVALRALLEGMKRFPGAAGAMEAQSRTLLGVWSTFKDTISIALVDAFAPVIPGIKDTLSDITPVLGDAIKLLAPVLGGLLTAVLKLLGPLLRAVSTALLPLIDALGTAIDKIDPATWDQLALAMAELGEALAPLVPLLVEFLVGGLEVAIPLLLLLAQVLKPVTYLLGLLAIPIHEFNRAMSMINWAEVGRAIADFFIGAWNAVKDFFSSVGARLGEVPERFQAAFDAARAAIVNRAMAMAEFVRSLPGRLMAALGDLSALLVQAGRDMVAGLWAGIVSRGEWLKSRVKQWVYDHTVGAAKEALRVDSPSRAMADEVGRWLPPGIGEGFMDALPGLRDTLASSARALPAPAMAGAMGASGAGGTGMAVTFGPGAIVINFAGAVTPAQAQDAGVRVGQGIADALARRGIATGARQRA